MGKKWTGNSYYIMIPLFLSLLGPGCKDEPQSPLITQVSPDTGEPGHSITIRGIRFGRSQGDGYVTFGPRGGAFDVEVISWDDDVIVALVPEDAMTGHTFIGVVTSGRHSNLAPFVVVNGRSTPDEPPPYDIEEVDGDVREPSETSVDTGAEDTRTEEPRDPRFELTSERPPQGASVWLELGTPAGDWVELLVMGQDLSGLAGVAFVLEVDANMTLERAVDHDGLGANQRAKLLAKQHEQEVVVGYTQLERRRRGVVIGEPTVLLGLLFNVTGPIDANLEFIEHRAHMRSDSRQFMDGQFINARFVVQE